VEEGGARPGRVCRRSSVIETYDAIIDAACEAWRKLIAQPQSHQPECAPTRDDEGRACDPGWKG
jgi:hypothetical protein